MKGLAVFLVTSALLWLCGAMPVRAGGPHVVFLNPGKLGADEGWTVNSRFMQAAADQFGIRLEILYADRDRIKMLDQARQVAARAVQPDYVVLVNEKQQGTELLEILHGTRSRLLLMHNDLTPEQRVEVGGERGQLSNWIGTIVTNEHDSARAMLAELFRLVPGEPQVLGISGDPATPVANQREGGARAHVEQAGRGRMVQVVPGEWSRQDGKEKALGLLARYGDVNVIWAANDLMALGAVDALRETGRQDRVVVGGLGAFPSALAGIGGGGLSVTIGGHMMVGAWAMVLIHDYHRGVDFAAADGVSLVSGTIAVIADRAAADRFLDLTERPWRIDFHRLSRADNPRLDHYDFSYDTVLGAVK